MIRNILTLVKKSVPFVVRMLVTAFLICLALLYGYISYVGFAEGGILRIVGIVLWIVAAAMFLPIHDLWRD